MDYTQNRELSWLNFNKRVLQVGEDPSTPLFERMKFVSIFQSNLSEFFMIRVGGLHDVAALKKDVIDNKSDMTATKQLEAIYAECHPLEELRDKVFANVEHDLWPHGVRRYTWDQLDDEQRKVAENYAKRFVLPVLSPQIIDPRHPFPHLQNGELYVATKLTVPEGDDEANADAPIDVLAVEEGAEAKSAKEGKSGGKKKKKSKKTMVQKTVASEPIVGVIPVQAMLPRILQLPGEGINYILLEEIVMHYTQEIFDCFETSDTVIVSVTRNADINPDDEEYVDDDYRQHMKKIIKKRKRLAPVRLMVQGQLSNELLTYFCKHLDIKQEQVFQIASPITLSYVFKIEGMLSPEQAAELLYTPFSPVFPADVDRGRSMFDQIREHDIMLSCPFDSIDPFLILLREAATDPEVISIKVTLYRMASYSKIAECLIEAAENGKDVVTLLELRARFDEEANINWAERFEEAGCTVLYGFEGYKVHSKICQITRKKNEGAEFFTHLSTGNYNEKTAAQYTDISIITADEEIAADGVEFFNNMAVGNLDGEYTSLLVSPTTFKSTIMAAMDDEIAKVQAGGSGLITIKCNSVTDLDLIEKLAEASQAGVHIELIIRGICCIVPGLEGLTDNITVTSIVGRFLEHSRIYCFGEGDEMRMYLSSADMMTRNTERRVEIAFPIKDPAVRQRIADMIKIMLSDTDRARRLLPDGDYVEIDTPEGEDAINSQSYFMAEALEKAAAAEKAKKEAAARAKAEEEAAKAAAEEAARKAAEEEAARIAAAEEAARIAAEEEAARLAAEEAAKAEEAARIAEEEAAQAAAEEAARIAAEEEAAKAAAEEEAARVATEEDAAKVAAEEAAKATEEEETEAAAEEAAKAAEEEAAQIAAEEEAKAAAEEAARKAAEEEAARIAAEEESAKAAAEEAAKAAEEEAARIAEEEAARVAEEEAAKAAAEEAARIAAEEEAARVAAEEAAKAAEAAAEAAAKTAPKKKKRGFFARLFGRS